MLAEPAEALARLLLHDLQVTILSRRCCNSFYIEAVWCRKEGARIMSENMKEIRCFCESYFRS